MESKDDLANRASFEIRRAMIVHEDQLITSRVAALLVAQSFLATAAVILLANARNAASPGGFYWLTLLIAFLSIVLGVLTDFSVMAARLAQREVRSIGTVYERVFPISGDTAVDWRQCLQSHTKWTEGAGFTSAAWLPVITSLTWTLFVYYCAVQIYGRNTAVATFVVSFALVAAAFLSIRRLLRRHTPSQSRTA